ncbi:tryptophan 7-halogenase [Sphingomonas hankookensis]|uniref:tryptophan 7-halogenase n=1 Tax=Sphingomonas hankookensis TaxID=563996 RepID=UPI001F5713EE|nr:tryptophan 7-halogenase [Sphingomonas hankookensis]
MAVRRILVCGDGLAAQMALTALARQVAPDTAILWVRAGDQRDGDLLYGSVTGPSAYGFNLAAGVDERQLVLGSDAAFSWGTRYAAWGAGRSWMQAFALPFPVIDGVVFHQYLARTGAGGIDPYVAGLQAARRGVFVHPPREAGGQHPLARAEYGYQVDPADYAALFAAARPADRVEVVEGAFAGAEVAGGRIAGIRLDDGRMVTADLYIDASGPAAVLGSGAPDGRRIGMAVRNEAGADEAPLRTVTATALGWQSATPLKGRTLHASVYAPDRPDEGALGRRVEATLGRRAQPWVGNCVAIGQAAGVVEPLTPAPMLLLERDIERLLSLIPVTDDCAVEAAEYNRRFADDYDHADLFQRAFFAVDGLPDGPYWDAARAEQVPEKLARKISLFGNRGLLVAYDLEPFHPEDWIILHLGMGRRPRRYDRLADRADKAQVAQFLTGMAREIERAVETLPPARVYRQQLEQFLRKAAS